MKKLLEKTIQYSKYEFKSGDATRVVVYNKEDFPNQESLIDFELVSEIEYNKWINWLNAQE
jgi:hypothetical protein